jgi:hypothetical protein
LKREAPGIESAVRTWFILAAAIALAVGMLLAPSKPAAGEPPSPGADAGPMLTAKAAAEFERKLIELSSTATPSHKSLKPIVVTDTEINSYLKYDRPEFLPPAVRHLVIHLKPEGIYGESNVNFDQLQAGQPSANDLGTKLVASIFRGDQKVTALAKIVSSNGTGKLTIQDVHVGSVALSDWLVNWLIQTYVESQYKIDLKKPFLLPPQVSRIEFAPGKAILVRNQAQKKD